MISVRRFGWMVVLWLACGRAVPSGDPVRLAIPPGLPVSAIAESLATHGIITSPGRFRWRARLTRLDRSIKAGVFDFRKGMSTQQALDVLVNGRTALERLVVQEGLMLTEVAAAVHHQLQVDSAAFMAAARDSALRARVGARGPTLEGYLYPSTYLVRIGAGPRDIIEQMVNEFERQWDPAWDRRLRELGLGRDELITLASIIEGEVRHDEDRTYVASVYLNRMKRGMRLQADPTVIYALGRRRRLFERDYDIRSPFNTYQIDGLPPHPIGQPGRASIQAALFPRSTDFLYFVAGSDGRHVFTRSYRDHLTAIRRIRDQD